MRSEFEIPYKLPGNANGTKSTAHTLSSKKLRIYAMFMYSEMHTKNEKEKHAVFLYKMQDYLGNGCVCPSV